MLDYVLIRISERLLKLLEVIEVRDENLIGEHFKLRLLEEAISEEPAIAHILEQLVTLKRQDVQHHDLNAVDDGGDEVCEVLVLEDDEELEEAVGDFSRQAALAAVEAKVLHRAHVEIFDVALYWHCALLDLVYEKWAVLIECLSQGDLDVVNHSTVIDEMLGEAHLGPNLLH